MLSRTTAGSLAAFARMNAPWSTAWVWRARLAASTVIAGGWAAIAAVKSASSVAACPKMLAAQASRTAGDDSNASWVIVPARQLNSAGVPLMRAARRSMYPSTRSNGSGWAWYSADANNAPVVSDQCSAAATARCSFVSKWWKNAPLVTPATEHRSSTVVAVRPLARMSATAASSRAVRADPLRRVRTPIRGAIPVPYQLVGMVSMIFASPLGGWLGDRRRAGRPGRGHLTAMSGAELSAAPVIASRNARGAWGCSDRVRGGACGAQGDTKAIGA